MSFMLNFVEHDLDGSDPEPQAPVLIMPPPPQRPSRWELWRNRLFLVEFIFVCIVIGILLIAVPWTPFWNDNSLLAGFPRIREWLMNDFVRGLVSGLGLVDLGLAVSEAVRYSEKS